MSDNKLTTAAHRLFGFSCGRITREKLLRCNWKIRITASGLTDATSGRNNSPNRWRLAAELATQRPSHAVRVVG